MRGQTVSAGRGISLLVLVLLLACTGTPPTVDQITIANPTDYLLDVHVTRRERDGWLPLALVEPRSESVIEEVIDQGEVWIFRLLHWGDEVGEFSVTRAELERSGWRVTVPEQVEERLRNLGRPPSD